MAPMNHVETTACVDHRRPCAMDLAEESLLANGEGGWTSEWVGETSVLQAATSCVAAAAAGLWTRPAAWVHHLARRRSGAA